jgi:hypothetical protein
MQRQIEQNRFLRFFAIFAYAHILNFILFGVISSIIGGDSLGLMPKEGRYFVTEHGHYTEVPKQLYEFSKVYAEYSLATFGVLLVVGIILKFSGYSPVKKLTLKEWMIAAIIPLFWLITFLIVK